MNGFGGSYQQQPQPQQPLLPQHLPQQQHAPFGLIIPGCPLRTDFVPIDPSGLKFALRLTCPGDIPVPLPTVRDVVFFIAPTIPQHVVPPDHGVLVYWQIASALNPAAAATGYELLGHVSPECPSAVFHTGWSEHEQTVELASPNAPPVIVTIGISIEPNVHIQNFSVSPNSSNSLATESRLLVAQKIASDLFKYMQSFDAGGGRGSTGQMVVPNNIFDRWMQRFEARFRRDPNFFLKSSD